MNTQKRFSAAKLLACLLLLVFSTSAFAQNAQPVAPVREVTDDYFGQKIVDPYRWMEDAKSAETAAWMKAQAAYTRAYLDRLPMRQELLGRIRSEEHTSELQSRQYLVCRLLLEKKNRNAV